MRMSYSSTASSINATSIDRGNYTVHTQSAQTAIIIRPMVN